MCSTATLRCLQGKLKPDSSAVIYMHVSEQLHSDRVDHQALCSYGMWGFRCRGVC